MNRRAEGEFNPLFLKQLLERFCDFTISTGRDGVEEFNHGHFGPKTGINGAHFKANNTSPDDNHFLRNFTKLKRAGGGHDGLFVDLNAGQGGWLRPGGDDDILGLVDLITDLDLTRSRDRTPTFEPVYLVLFHQEFNAASVLANDVGFISLHLLPIDGRRFALQAHFGKVMLCFVQHVGRVQQGFGRDTTDVQASSTKRFAAFDDGRFQAQLGAADGRYIAAGACSDDDNVVVCHGVSPKAKLGCDLRAQCVHNTCTDELKQKR